MSTATPYDGAQRQPAAITVVQTLLVLSAVGSAVGLIVSVYLVSVVLEAVTRFQAAFSSFGGAGAAEPGALSATSSPQLTVSIVLAVVEAVAVVAVSIWAFRAVGRAQPLARTVLAALAGAQVVLSVAGTVAAGAGVGFVAVLVVVGLLVFDAPVLVLLFVPAESRRWFTGPAAAGSPGPPASGPATRSGPAPSWGPPSPQGPPASAPFPARPSGTFPQPPQSPRHGPPPESGGRHSAPRQPPW